jgi:Putative auto-transporter adhesin, head GIN domain
MKQLLSAVLVSAALLTGTFAYSKDAKPVRIATKEISATSSFDKIQVGNGINIILLQNGNKSPVVITGDENLIAAVKVSIDNGILSIASKKNLKGRNIKIYVSVATISSLELGNNASVVTEGVVKLDDLKVIVNDGGTLALQVAGNVHIEPAPGCDFVYDTYEKSKDVFDQQ